MSQIRPTTGAVLVVHPSSDLYGADRMLLEAVRGLVAHYGDVVVALPASGPLVPLLLQAGARVEEVPMLVLQRRFLKPRQWPALVRDTIVGAPPAYRLLRRLKPQAVYVSTQVLPLWPLMGRGMRTHVVVHVHEAEVETPRFIRLGLALPVLPAHRVLVPSDCALSVLVGSLPQLTGRSTVVLNGVIGPEKPRPARVELDGELRILFVGRLMDDKGVHLLVEGMRILEERGVNAVLDVVGDVAPAQDWYRQRLRQLIEAAGVTDRIRLHGFQANVWPWMEAADVVAVPSVVPESFGNTAVEAVLAARPAVVANHSGLREAVAGYGSVQRTDTLGSDAAARLADAFVAVRARWPDFRAAAIADSGVARQRHDPEAYGQHVAAAIAALSSPPIVTPPQCE